MVEDSTTDGATPDQLARLLQLAKESIADASDDAQAGDSLAHLLGTPLPVQDLLTQSLPDIIQQMVKEWPPLAAKPLERLLFDSTTDLAVIRRIKAYAKAKAKAGGSSPTGEAATVVYYAALAHALIYHDQRITALSLVNLRASFQELMLNHWLDRRLIELFRQAVAACSQRAEKEPHL